MKQTLYTLCCLCLFVACQPSNKDLAEARLAKVQDLIADNKLNQAKIEIDSIHLLYPKEVDARRTAKRWNDTITCREAERTLHYIDSLLPNLHAQADQLLKQFRYEKQDKYENNGRYVHKLLNTDTNTARCFMQCYVTDQRETILKSYYYGQKAIHHTHICLTANELDVYADGTNHTFEAEGWHEIMQLKENDAIQLLQFISANRNERIRVKLEGQSTYLYYLQSNEKQALEATYQLAILMRDIRTLEQNASIAQTKLAKLRKE